MYLLYENWNLNKFLNLLNYIYYNRETSIHFKLCFHLFFSHGCC